MQNERDIFIFASLPSSYPFGFPVEGVELIQALATLSLSDIPAFLCACDQPSRARIVGQTALHFYRDDKKFMRVLLNPEKYVRDFSKYKAVLTPDCSLTFGMPPSKRAHQTRLSRVAGAIWQSRGLLVIPSLRWVDDSDYDLICSGIPQGSVFAVSNYGSIRDPKLRDNFSKGLLEVVSRLNPVAIIVFGRLPDLLLSKLESTTQVFQYSAPTASPVRCSNRKTESNENDLFEN